MNIKKFLLFFIIGYSNLALADAIIFNKSAKYDMEVTYNFCFERGPTDPNYPGYTCTPPQLTLVKHDANNETNYARVLVPPSTTDQFMNILSVAQKNEKGKTVVEATYNIEEIACRRKNHTTTNRCCLP